MRLTQQQLEAHLWGAANILRGKIAGQDYKDYILSLMNWSNAAIGKINSVLHGLETRSVAGGQRHHRSGLSGRGRHGAQVLAAAGQFPLLRRILVAQEGDLRQVGLQGPLRALRARHRLQGPADRARQWLVANADRLLMADCIAAVPQERFTYQ
jgi:hypothetical protein